MTDRFRCSEAAASQPMAGSSARDRYYLLVEHPGPWGRVALDESRWLPEEVRTGLAGRAGAAGVRVLLIRRHGAPDRAAATPAFRVFLASSAPDDPWLVGGTLADPRQLLDLPLEQLDAGPPAGFERRTEPLFLVCTNGRRDLCCAERGRPVAAAFHEALPEATWEVTHLGGHRFAAAMLLLPGGFSYGRISPDDVPALVGASTSGRLVPDLLRGRAGYSPAAQAAEVALLQHRGLDRADALVLVGEEATDAVTRVTFRHGELELEAEVEEVPEPPQRQSCADLTLKPSSTWRVRPPAGTPAASA